MQGNIRSFIAPYNRKIFKDIGIIDIAAFIARIALGTIFLFASFDKITHNALFEQNVTNYHMLPAAILPIFSYILPWIELLVGIYLILGVFLQITTYVTMLLLIMFIVALTYALITHQPVTSCGCFSQDPTATIGWIDVIRDIGFFILAVIILLPEKTNIAIDRFLFHKE